MSEDDDDDFSSFGVPASASLSALSSAHEMGTTTGASGLGEEDEDDDFGLSAVLASAAAALPAPDDDDEFAEVSAPTLQTRPGD